MRKTLIGLAVIFSIGSLSAIGYYTHRLWVFAAKVSKGFEYSYAAIDCLIQESGQNQSNYG